MTIFKLDPPIATTSIGGFSVSIESVDPSLLTDQISGKITTGVNGVNKSEWDDAGIKRGGDPSSRENIDMNLPELAIIKRMLT